MCRCVIIFILAAASLCSQIQAQEKDSCIKSPDVMPPKKRIRINSIRMLLDNFHAVESGKIYRSRQIPASRLARYIQKLHIKSIINLRGKNEHTRWWQQEKMVAEKHGVKLYNIPMTARCLSKRRELVRLLYLYHHAPRPILIHCQSGSDRTGEAAALWKLCQQKKSKREALTHLSIKYGHLRPLRPAKYFFISQWGGTKWLCSRYNHTNYPQFN